MNDMECTLTSPMLAIRHDGEPMLGLTIAWHPDPDRVGQQFIVAARTEVLELSRYLPLFHRPEQAGHGLGHGGVSREPLRIVRESDGGIEIRPPESRMVVELNGAEIHCPTRLSSAQVEAGAILGLGRTVLLCLHWMRCLPRHNPAGSFLGVGNAAIKTRDLIRQVAATDSPVLLLGETGCGKEVAARALHALSPRASAPLVAVNMAALNESLAAADLFGAARGAYTGAQTARNGWFAEAEGGTLFLDEIGNTPASVQPMLLRVLECGQYRPLGAQRDQISTARLIAATDQNLYTDSFNQALLRRLESFIIPIPPLRARREDIGLLLVHLLRIAPPGTTDCTLPTALVSRFVSHDWPGNIRQLTHVFRRAALALQNGEHPDFEFLVDEPTRESGVRSGIRSGERSSADRHKTALPAQTDDKPVMSTTDVPHRKKPSHLSVHDVLAAMENSYWNVQGAADALGISRPSMYKLLEENPQIRAPEKIPTEEIRQAMLSCGGDPERCASLLKTPCEALRRHVRALGLADVH
jgi:two-component system nitrogen regulation response regulator GlnG